MAEDEGRRGGEKVCEGCGAALAADQRYCLRCGRRQGAPRVSYEYLQVREPAGADVARADQASPLAAVLGIALLAAMLLVGVLIGREDQDQVSPSGATQPTAGKEGGPPSQARPEEPGPDATPEKQGGANQTTGAGDVEANQQRREAANGGGSESDSEWPDGKSGFTVQLYALPKAGATKAEVEQLRKDFEQSGAEVGVLDGDLFDSLPARELVFYMGIFETKAQAKASLPDARAVTGEATVVEVSGG